MERKDSRGQCLIETALVMVVLGCTLVWFMRDERHGTHLGHKTENIITRVQLSEGR